MAKQITKTTVELSITPRRFTLKVLYPNGEGLKIAYSNKGHQITAINRQITDALLCKILRFVSKYDSNVESDGQRFKRLAACFSDTVSIDRAVSSFC